MSILERNRPPRLGLCCPNLEVKCSGRQNIVCHGRKLPQMCRKWCPPTPKQWHSIVWVFNRSVPLVFCRYCYFNSSLRLFHSVSTVNLGLMCEDRWWGSSFWPFLSKDNTFFLRISRWSLALVWPWDSYTQGLQTCHPSQHGRGIP